MRLARHADSPTRLYPDTCSSDPGDESPGDCQVSLRDKLSCSSRAFYFLENVQTAAAGFDPCLRKLVASQSFLLLIVGASIESEHNNKMLGENERIVWVSERTFLCRMHMTRS